MGGRGRGTGRGSIDGNSDLLQTDISIVDDVGAEQPNASDVDSISSDQASLTSVVRTEGNDDNNRPYEEMASSYCVDENESQARGARLSHSQERYQQPHNYYGDGNGVGARSNHMWGGDGIPRNGVPTLFPIHAAGNVSDGNATIGSTIHGYAAVGSTWDARDHVTRFWNVRQPDAAQNHA